MAQSNKSLAENALNELVRLDEEVTGAYYDMGRILSAMVHNDLHEFLDYESMYDLVTEELSFAWSTAQTYYQSYDHFKRLGYSREEAIKLIREFSFTKLSTYILPRLKEKIGIRAMKNRIEQIDIDQINFTLKKSDHRLLDTALRKYGAEKVRGRWVHSSAALMEMVNAALQCNGENAA